MGCSNSIATSIYSGDSLGMCSISIPTWKKSSNPGKRVKGPDPQYKPVLVSNLYAYVEQPQTENYVAGKKSNHYCVDVSCQRDKFVILRS